MRGDEAPDIQVGELVVGCNGEPVRSVHDLNEQLRQVPKEANVRLEILEPSGDRRFVTVQPRTER